MTVLASGPVTTGLLGFLVFLGLGLACVFLFRSMLHHMRKVPPSFDEPSDDREGPAPDGRSDP